MFYHLFYSAKSQNTGISDLIQEKSDDIQKNLQHNLGSILVKPRVNFLESTVSLHL